VKLPLTTLAAHECPYLPNRIARSRAFWADELPPKLYHAFMDTGFRRSGKLVYQPICAGCRACVPIRVPVSTFRPSKSQRRCWQKNVGLITVTWDVPRADDESFMLYRRYVNEWHDRGPNDDGMGESREDFEAFLYESPVATLEFKYRDATADGRLLAVGICDTCERESLSSVYFYFDPAQSHRGLGTYGALWEIDFARRAGIAHYYLGYHVNGCRSMQYKTSFRPYELLRGDGVWVAAGADEVRDTNVALRPEVWHE
jgi:arginine-tRNA-protein transferase